MNIIAVVVTYNRLVLLKEAIFALRGQPFLNAIVVVNNNSDDGTEHWLKQEPDLIVITQQNRGGSGGFYTGLKAATEMKADWVWVMDDDTICGPDSLQKLIEPMKHIQEPIGFIGSKSVWKDGNPHLMNIPAISPSFNGNLPFNKYDSLGLLLVETTSFVSLLINAAAIKEVGLPYEDFFIWGDDQEYTRRITKTGKLGFYCSESVVLHKTGINYFPDFYRDTVPNLWKHSYGFRNEFFMIKKNKGLLFFALWLPAKLLYTSYRIMRLRSTDRLKFIRVLLAAGWASVFFNPKIEMITVE